MSINWNEVQQALSPLKDYEDCCRRFEQAFSYPIIVKAYNLTLTELIDYTQRLLLGDSRHRYNDYHTRLAATLQALVSAGTRDVSELAAETNTRTRLEAFTGRTRLPALDIVMLLKYLVYWFIPNQKYLSGLVGDNPQIKAAILSLRNFGIRSNLDMLDRGTGPADRMKIAAESGLPNATITELVNRADFSRLPWSSKATISNIIGAGYASLEELRNAEPDKLYADFFAYGKKIGKNLKLGNEIENSYRISKIIPILVEND
jgi:Domain of unknown function (DUF4332)